LEQAMNARSLVGMSQSARKRQARRDREAHPDLVPANRAPFFLHGARLRPCPGCRSCSNGWSDADNLLRSVWDRGFMCQGTGVLPARRSPAYGLRRPEDWDQHDFQWPWERFTSQICRRCDLSAYPGIKAIGTCYPMPKEKP
jgi:hypothetical protein